MKLNIHKGDDSMSIEKNYVLLVSKEDKYFISADYTFTLDSEQYEEDKEYWDAYYVVQALNHLSQENGTHVRLVKAEVQEDDGLEDVTEYVNKVLIKHEQPK